MAGTVDACLDLIDRWATNLTAQTGVTRTAALTDIHAALAGRHGQAVAGHYWHRIDAAVGGLLSPADTPRRTGYRRTTTTILARLQARTWAAA